MKIDITNYEEKFLDYHEGNLTAEEVAELFLFIEKHPNLREEFESFDIISIASEDISVSFPDKQFLKQLTTPSIDSIQQWLIAEMEGELTLQQRILLSTFIKENPQFEKERILFRNTKLTAGISEIYSNKDNLKRTTKKPIGIGITSRMWYSAAAAVIILIGAWYILLSPSVKPETAYISPVKIDSTKTPSTNNSVDTNTSTNSSIETIIKKENNSANQPQIANKIKFKNRIKTPAGKQQVPTEEQFANQKTIQPNSIDDLNVANIPFNDSVPPIIENATPISPNEIAMQQNNAPAAITQEKLTTKSKFIRWVANFVNKVSDDKVKVKTTFDPTSGDLAAYRVEMGKNTWQKIKDY